MIKPVELPSHGGREAALGRTGYSASNLDARGVYIDLLTNSGTEAMSAERWAAVIRSDKTYANSESFARLAESVRDVMEFGHVVPAHQGHGAENIFYGVLLEGSDVVPNSSHFDTTRVHVVNQGAESVDRPSPAVCDPSSTETFKGNFDIDAGYALAKEIGAGVIPIVTLIITNNSVTDQPISMANIHATAEFVRGTDTMFIVNAYRLAESAHFIRTHKVGHENHSVAGIARTQFECTDTITMSKKKGALVNIGDFAVVRDETVLEHAKQCAVLYEDFSTYGGLSGRGVEAMAVGLRGAAIPPHITDRVEQVAKLGDLLVETDVPVYQPTNGHAIYLDAGGAFPHIPKEEFPGQELACAPYPGGGVRGIELGGSAFSSTNRSDLVRLALPWYACSREHLERVARMAAKMMASAGKYSSLEIATEPPMKELRHFSSRLEPMSD